MFWSANQLAKKPYTVIIIPAGHGTYAGRSIGERFERGLTLQLAHAIELGCKQSAQECTIVVYTGSDYQRSSSTETAHVTNRLNPDLVIALSLYHETNPKPHWYLYHYSAGDHFVQLPQALQLIAVDQAHLVNSNTTRTYVNLCYKELLKNSFFVAHEPTALPITALAGITAPAFLCEIGIKQPDDWCTATDPIIQFIITAQKHA